jgi:hypothetical protein
MEDDVYRGMFIPKGSLVRLLRKKIYAQFNPVIDLRQRLVCSVIFYVPICFVIPTLLGLPLPRAVSDIYVFRAITRDETLFPNASAFLPERYLEKVEPALAKRRDPRSYVFVRLPRLATSQRSTKFYLLGLWTSAVSRRQLG